MARRNNVPLNGEARRWAYQALAVERLVRLGLKEVYCEASEHVAEADARIKALEWVVGDHEETD